MQSVKFLAALMASTRALSIMFFQFYFYLCFLFIGVHGRTDAEGALNDVRALLEFKKSITYDPFSLLKNWDDTASSTACNWTGISCSTKHPGRVVQINLENATLRGSLSPQLANLSYLQVLALENNFLSGKIPSVFSRLHRLKVLDLCRNELEGAIPYHLGNISSLQVISLCENSLSAEIPQSLAMLKGLSYLNLVRNGLTGQIPSWLGELHQLQLLQISENNFFHGVIPAQLGNLSSLQKLSLGDDHLMGAIPCSLASLQNLKSLSLRRNTLIGSIPHCIGNLTELTVLDLSGNHLQGNLPDWLGSLHDLQKLSFFNNQFAGGIPESWRNVTQLQVLVLSRNRLTGTLPSWLGTVCSQLGILSLGKNYFSSSQGQPIPILESLSNCSQLTELTLYDNMLRGSLPPNFGSSWPNLQDLELPDNFISGNIPASIGNLSSLIRLVLRNNIFSGSIPPQLANLKSVQGISLSSNLLSGKIPNQLSRLNMTLAFLYLNENKLSASIPTSMGDLVNLRDLYLYDNMLHGEIPSELGNCLLLEDLVLSANKLSGAIPTQVASLKHIIFNFDLSGNRLSGEVSPQIRGLQMTQRINLSRNHLSGNIASCIDSWLDAREIDLSLNKFSGNLSSTLGYKITQLQVIDLSHNNFTGSVPASLFNLSFLSFLNFSYNNFDEEVPCLHSSSKSNLRLSRWSFLQNPNLCGRCFGLRACRRSAEQHHGSRSDKNSMLKIVLGIIGCLLVLVVIGVVVFVFRRIKTFKVETPRIREQFLRISVNELIRATDNFSASNLMGEGIHGKVYKGVLNSGDLVAVKCFPFTSQWGSEKSFRKECHALRKVRHRNILKIITVVCSDQVKAIVTPFMNNGNLYSLLHKKENGQLTLLRLSVRLKILTELAMGLSYLHHDCSFQIIHCDIKPENVLLDEDMTVKLSDFGIARLMGDDVSATSSSLAVKGSIGYIAPEYGIGGGISIKGDVYSFGVVTLEVITRLKPTNEMFSGNLTLPQWISNALEGKSSLQRKEMLKVIIKAADGGGGGIEMDKDEEMLAVETILMVGLRCTRQDAGMRPSMRAVESILQSINVGSIE